MVQKICFYHSKDFDGKCSGAIVKAAIPDVQLYGIDYPEDFPIDLIKKGMDVYMVDYSVQIPLLDKINKSTNLVLIDHHKTFVDGLVKSGIVIKGAQEISGKSAALLAWEYFFPGEPIPWTVQLISDYDVWNIQKDVMEFQYGLRAVDPDIIIPENTEFWRSLLTRNKTEETIRVGTIIYKYVKSSNKQYAQTYAFRGKFMEFNALFLNTGFSSSIAFEDYFDSARDQLCVGFVMLPDGRWAVSLRSFNDEINCGKIALRNGGGGHTRAAGFQSEDLSFIGRLE